MPKKHFIQGLLFAIIVFAVTASAQTGTKKQKNNDWTEFHLKGKIKSIRSVEYVANLDSGKLKKAAEQPDDVSGLSEEYYNDSGYRTEVVSYIYDNKVHNMVKYRYDKNGNRIDELYYGSKGNLVDRKSYRYDSAGNRTAVFMYKSNGKPRLDDSTVYDSNGNYIKEITYSEDGKVWSIFRYVYDRNGNRIEDDDYDKDKGQFHARLKHKYDDKGNEIEEDYDQLFDKTFFQYDERGNRLKQTIYTNKKFLYRDTYKYDPMNNPIEHVYYMSDSVSLYYKEVYSYDKQGNEILYKRMSDDSSGIVQVTKTTYEYDKFGNWTKQVIHRKGEDDYYVTERALTYYR